MILIFHGALNLCFFYCLVRLIFSCVSLPCMCFFFLVCHLLFKFYLKYLFNSFAYFFIVLSVILLSSCKSSLHILDTRFLSDNVLQIFSLICGLLFIWVSYEKFFNSDEVQFQYFLLCYYFNLKDLWLTRYCNNFLFCFILVIVF